MEVNASGTLGDVYIIVLKLYNTNVKKINHYSKHDDFFPKIREIYSLLGNVEVITHKIDKGDSILNSTIKGFFNKNDNYSPFPKFDLPNISKYNIPDDYYTIQLISGINPTITPWRNLNENDINVVPTDKPLILLGTDNKDIGFLIENNYNIIDMRKKCSLLESFSIINKSDRFYAPQGLLSFFAVSQKVKTTVWIKHYSDVIAVKSRINMVGEWNNYIKYEYK